MIFTAVLSVGMFAILYMLETDPNIQFRMLFFGIFFVVAIAFLSVGWFFSSTRTDRILLHQVDQLLDHVEDERVAYAIFDIRYGRVDAGMRRLKLVAAQTGDERVAEAIALLESRDSDS